jgi:hypothetical protein
MYYTVVKLDNRFSFHEKYKWCLEFSKGNWKGTGVLYFDRSRRWMNQTWGWSQDVHTQQTMEQELHRHNFPLENDINPHWAYSIIYKDYRIYLAGEAELNWFVLSNPNESHS